MADVFDGFVQGLLTREGGGTYTNRPSDKGGPTRWGVTAKALGAYRKLGREATPAEVQALGQDEATSIYRTTYFVKPGFDQIARVSARVAEEMLDSGVNMGPDKPCVWLQRSLNLCNRQGLDWADVPLTGVIGPMTTGALSALIQRRGVRAGEDLLLKCLNGFQFERYVEITEAGGPNSANESSFVGWITQRIGFAAA